MRSACPRLIRILACPFSGSLQSPSLFLAQEEPGHSVMLQLYPGAQRLPRVQPRREPHCVLGNVSSFLMILCPE